MTLNTYNDKISKPNQPSQPSQPSQPARCCKGKGLLTCTHVTLNGSPWKNKSENIEQPTSAHRVCMYLCHQPG